MADQECQCIEDMEMFNEYEELTEVWEVAWRWSAQRMMHDAWHFPISSFPTFPAQL